MIGRWQRCRMRQLTSSDPSVKSSGSVLIYLDFIAGVCAGAIVPRIASR